MNGYEYEAVFTNSQGSATTNAVTMKVDYVTTQPLTQAVNAGVSATLAAASSNGGINGDDVQWQVSTDGGKRHSPTSPVRLRLTYTCTPTSSDNNNQYQAVFTNTYGSFATNPATLTVDLQP